MNTQNIDKSKKAKKATKTSTKSVKKKDVNKNIKKACKAKNKSTEIKTNLVTNEASINTTANQSPKNESKRKFTLDIIELLDGKVNKNIVFFGFIFLILILLTCSETYYSLCPIHDVFRTKPNVLSSLKLKYTLLFYLTYLIFKHGFIVKSFFSCPNYKKTFRTLLKLLYHIIVAFLISIVLFNIADYLVAPSIRGYLHIHDLYPIVINAYD